MVLQRQETSEAGNVKVMERFLEKFMDEEETMCGRFSVE
jgi:hypothetical protein